VSFRPKTDFFWLPLLVAALLAMLVELPKVRRA